VIVDPDSLKEKEIDLTSSSSLDVISNSEVTKDGLLYTYIFNISAIFCGSMFIYLKLV
jgi:hypothetical protein